MGDRTEKLHLIIEHLIDGNRDDAKVMIHDFIIEAGREQWDVITERDNIVEDEIQGDDFDDEEGIDTGDQESDFVDDVQVDINDDGELEPEEEGEPEGIEVQLDKAEDGNKEMGDTLSNLRAAFAAYNPDEDDEGVGDEEGYDDEGYNDEEGDEYVNGETEEEVQPFKEGAVLKPVNISSKDKSNNKSPIAKNAKSATGAKAHKIDTAKGKESKASSPKKMNVDGPQENKGFKPYTIKKNPDVKSNSPIKGIKNK